MKTATQYALRNLVTHFNLQQPQRPLPLDLTLGCIDAPEIFPAGFTKAADSVGPVCPHIAREVQA